MDYHHLQEIKEARPIKSKIVSEQWRMGRGKRQLLFFFSFPVPSSPACFLFPLSPASLRHQKASGSLWGGQKFHRVRLTEAQAQWDPRRAQWNEPTVCRCQRKDSAFFTHSWVNENQSYQEIYREHNMVYGKIMTVYSLSSCTFIPFAPHPSHRASIKCLFFWLDVDEVHTFSTQDARTTGEQNED